MTVASPAGPLVYLIGAGLALMLLAVATAALLLVGTREERRRARPAAFIAMFSIVALCWTVVAISR